MDFVLDQPALASPIVGVRLLTAVFQFPNGPISVSLIEERQDGSLEAQSIVTSPEETAAYFATAPSPDGFFPTFGDAFQGLVQRRYPSARVVHP